MPHAYELYLIRHGVAEAQGDAWPDDAKRPLTADGMARVRKEARGLVRLGGAFDPRPHLAPTDALTPDGTYAMVLAELAKHARRARIALVGHEPGIGELAARLVGARHPMPFKKGAVCCIEVDALPPAGPGALRWFVPPRILRSIKK